MVTESFQAEDGIRDGTVTGVQTCALPILILSQYIIVQCITGRPVDETSREKMILYFRVSRTAEGVWGMHPESKGYVFFTTLAYVALRLQIGRASCRERV